MANQQNNSIFSRLYRTRLIVGKDATPIANVSLLYCIIAALTAPWLFIGSLIAAVALGYKVSCERNVTAFSGDLGAVVNDAKNNVRNAMDSFTGNGQPS